MSRLHNPNEALYLHKATWRFEVVLEGRHLVALQRFTGSWFAALISPMAREAIGRILNASRASMQDTPPPTRRR